MATALVWCVWIFVILFVLILGVEWLLSEAGGEGDTWYKTRSAWTQPLIGAGGGALAVLLIWLVILGIKASL